jgi:RNA methyltransferase, TrmH family
MKHLSSRHNRFIIETAQLHDSRTRKAFKAFLAEGIRTIETLAQAGASIEALFYSDEQKIPNGISPEVCYRVTPKIMKKLSGAHTPSGVIARVAIPETTALTDQKALILYGLQDPGNVGTLIRSAVACGIHEIACIETADPYSYKSVQASAGTIGFARVGIWSWDAVYAQRKAPLIALTPRGGNSAHYRTNGWFVVGSEGQGIPPWVVAACDDQCTLSMPGTAESFNAAVAGSLALYISFVPLHP